MDDVIRHANDAGYHKNIVICNKADAICPVDIDVKLTMDYSRTATIRFARFWKTDRTKRKTEGGKT